MRRDRSCASQPKPAIGFIGFRSRPDFCARRCFVGFTPGAPERSTKNIQDIRTVPNFGNNIRTGEDSRTRNRLGMIRQLRDLLGSIFNPIAKQDRNSHFKIIIRES